MEQHRSTRWLAAPLCLILTVSASGKAFAGAGEACRDQAAIAEHSVGIPDGLLLAIGKRESGRVDPDSGNILPWPWAVNRDGESHIFESQAEAVTYVAAAQREGSRSIDVGCFQINLQSHPDAFPSLDEAFDPAANAAYAARFLGKLHDQEGNWETAVARYHSSTPWFGEPYRDAVLALWHDLAPPAATTLAAMPGPTRVVMGIRIWEGPGSPIPDRAIGQKIAPVMAAAIMPANDAAVQTIGSKPRRGLPRVFTP